MIKPLIVLVMCAFTATAKRENSGLIHQVEFEHATQTVTVHLEHAQYSLQARLPYGAVVLYRFVEDDFAGTVGCFFWAIPMDKTGVHDETVSGFWGKDSTIGDKLRANIPKWLNWVECSECMGAPIALHNWALPVVTYYRQRSEDGYKLQICHKFMLPTDDGRFALEKASRCKEVSLN